MNSLCLFFMLLCWLQLACSNTFSQDPAAGTSLFDQILNETGDEEKSRELYEQLVYLTENPLNINTCTEEDLEELYFLSDFHIFSLLQFRKKYGRFYSLGELNLVPGFHPGLVKNISPFLNTGDDEEKIFFLSNQKVRMDLLIRLCLKNPPQKGFSSGTDSLEKFQGNRYKELLRYHVQYGKNIHAGLCLEKDEGEAFKPYRKTNPSGFGSAYIQVDHAGIIHKMVAGDYRFSGGSGLVYGFGRTGKSTEVVLSHKLPALTKYSSSAETGFFRGIAADFRKGRAYLITGVSSHHRSGKTEESRDAGKVITSLNSTGLSRNRKELMYSGNIRERSVGLMAGIHSDAFTAGYNLNYLNFSLPLSLRIRPDRYSDHSYKKSYLLQSIHYSFRHKEMIFFGEVSVSDTGKPAIIQSLSFRIHSLITASLSYRSYNPSYIGFYNSPPAESSAKRNEKGFYTGVEFFPCRFIRTSVYLDLYRFPWLKYNSSSPFAGYDFLVNNTISLSRDFNILLLFKKEKGWCEYGQADAVEGLKRMIPEDKTRVLLQADWKPQKNFSLKSRCEVKHYTEEKSKRYSGSFLSQDINFSLFDGKLKTCFRIAMFDSPDWDVRIYAWEQDLLYSFSSPLFYGSGLRYYFTGRWKISPQFTFWIKMADTSFMNVHESGSGADYRSGKNFSELKVQLQWKLH